MSNNNSRIPLHMQNADIAKAARDNPSWESARPHQIHVVDHRYQGEKRPNTHMMSVIRRNPDGQLDYQWAKNMVIDAVHNLSVEHALTQFQQALVTIVFPEKPPRMEPMQANLLTQFSDSEKSRVRQLVEAQLLEEENWNAGRGGGSVDGRGKTRTGTP